MYALSERAARSSDPTAISRATGQLEWVGQRLMAPSILVVVGLGIWLVVLEEDISFSQLWIWLALVLVVASALPGVYSGPEKRGSRAWLRSDEATTARSDVAWVGFSGWLAWTS